MAYLLIIDDDADFADAISTVCRAAGHETAIVHTPTDALTSVVARRPDGILLDVMFPEDPSAGFKLARELHRRFGQLPVLLLTAVNQRFPLGFSSKDIDPDWLPVAGLVEKPVAFPVLLEKVDTMLAAARARAQT
jgi:CheY-like chemotaxis protein